MIDDWVMTLCSQAFMTIALVAGPLLLVSMVIGIFVSVIQAITQINEATLTFIPKVLAIVVVLSFMSPWMLDVLKNYTTDMIGNVHEWIR